MKGILVAFALLQLVVLDEGFRWRKTPVIKIPPKLTLNKRPQVTKSCPRNPKLEEMRKALGLETGRSRGKRRVSRFPIDCLHVGIVELNSHYFFHYPLYKCCKACHFPYYVSCLWNGNPSWLCASRAYKCICDCRKRHVKASHLLRKAKPQKKFKASDRICKKKTCSYARCCVEDQCIQLYVHKQKSAVRQ